MGGKAIRYGDSVHPLVGEKQVQVGRLTSPVYLRDEEVRHTKSVEWKLIAPSPVTSIEERKVRGMVPFSRIGAHSTRYHTQRITNKITVENGSNLSLAGAQHQIRSGLQSRREREHSQGRLGRPSHSCTRSREPLDNTRGSLHKGSFGEGGSFDVILCPPLVACCQLTCTPVQEWGLRIGRRTRVGHQVTGSARSRSSTASEPHVRLYGRV